jgi:hypothetical protein
MPCRHDQMLPVVCGSWQVFHIVGLCMFSHQSADYSMCISHESKLDLVTIQGNLTGDQYIRDVLQPVVVLHFDNHPLATRHVYMNDNARLHRSRAVTAYLQREVVTSVPWPAMSTYLNPIEHIWDRATRTLLKAWGKRRCSGGVGRSCTTRCVNLYTKKKVKHPMFS